MRRSPAVFGVLLILAAVEFAHPAHAEDVAPARGPLPPPVVRTVPVREVVVRVPPRPQPPAAATPARVPVAVQTVAAERAVPAERVGVAKRLGTDGATGPLSAAAFDATLRATPSWQTMVEVGPTAPGADTGGAGVLKFRLSSCSSVVFGWSVSDAPRECQPLPVDRTITDGFGGPYAGIWLHL